LVVARGRELGRRAGEVEPPGFADGRGVGHERGDQMIIKCFA